LPLLAKAAIIGYQKEKRMNNEIRLQDLKFQAAAIREQCEFWKKSQDGSYEMALDSAGYYLISDQIKLLEGKQLLTESK